MEITGLDTAVLQGRPTSSSTRIKSNFRHRPRYLDLNGKHLETITALGRTSVIIRCKDRAIKIPRRLDTTHMVEAHRLKEEDMWELNCESIENEIRIYKHLGHHNGILEVRSSEGAIEMPFMMNGTLHNYLQKHQVDWAQKLRWIQQAISTIHEIHKRDVIHGDISTMNFLVTNDGSILLSDFGESVMLEIGLDRIDGFSRKTDLFQFGSLVFEIVTGQKYVYDAREGGENEDQQWPKNCELPNIEGFLLGDLMQRCWVRDGFQNMSEVSNYLKTELGSILVCARRRRNLKRTSQTDRPRPRDIERDSNYSIT